VVADVESEHVTEVFTAVGEKGVASEKVAGGLADEVRRYLDSGVPVGEHLADQLLLPMALAGGGSYRTGAPTLHTTTHADVVRRFLDVAVSLARGPGDAWEVVVGERTPSR
jgi:RNA 3'-terminal phosphate cyclase (ATP)